MILEAIMEADYKKLVKEYDLEQVEESGIVFIGDSIIKYYDTNKYFSNENQINRGIPGGISQGVLNRLYQIDKIKPKIIIINIGSNDIVRTKDSVDEIVKRILRVKYELETNNPSAKVYLLTLPPVLRDHEITSKAYMKHRNNDIIDEINEELSIFTNLIDTNSCLKDNNNNLKLEYTTDGLHLTNAGYEVFSKVLANEIPELKLK